MPDRPRRIPEATVSRLERERDEARAPVQPDPTPDREGTPLRWSAVAQHAFAVALAGASEWRVGLKDVIKVLGAEGGWDAVTAWTPDDGAVLRCAAMWAADHELAANEHNEAVNLRLRQ